MFMKLGTETYLSVLTENKCLYQTKSWLRGTFLRFRDDGSQKHIASKSRLQQREVTQQVQWEEVIKTTKTTRQSLLPGGSNLLVENK